MSFLLLPVFGTELGDQDFRRSPAKAPRAANSDDRQRLNGPWVQETRLKSRYSSCHEADSGPAAWIGDGQIYEIILAHQSADASEPSKTYAWKEAGDKSRLGALRSAAH